MSDTLKWYEKSGNNGDIIISTRVRFARNIERFPFPSRMTLEQKEEIIRAVDIAINSSPVADRFCCKQLSDISDTERVSLVERHLVSPEFISDPDGRAVFIYDDESVSIMVNEEDHLRIQVMCEGFDFETALETADRIDTLLNEKLNFAFDDKLGYLTQCPTNLGTGMRASIMLHLPALQDSGTISRIASNLSKLGLTIRGTYGEASKPVGAIYQLSNQITLGLSEQEAINNLKDISNELILKEQAMRTQMITHLEIQDRISRSCGILKSAKLLTKDEFMRLISNIRFGISCKLISNIDIETINALTVHVQPATIQLLAGKPLKHEERDALRAKLTSEALPE